MPLRNNAPSLEEVMQRLAADNKDAPDHDWGLTYVIARNIIRLFSIIPRVLFLRRHFGERYMQAYHVVGTWFIAAFAAFGTALSSLATPWDTGAPRSGSVVGFLFLLVFTVMLGVRYSEVLRRKMRNELTVHSYSEGEAWAVWQKLRVPPNVVGMVIEPVLILAVGYLLGRVLELPSMQLLAVITAVAHFVEQQIVAAQERARLLDVADALIEQRMAEERLAIVQAGPRRAPARAHVAGADQQELQQLLNQTRAQAAGADPRPAGGE
jgi:hypothetical protein